jgi:uncharacterized lipoprotein YehR (DUF1307 family)
MFNAEQVARLLVGLKEKIDCYDSAASDSLQATLSFVDVNMLSTIARELN